MHQRPYGGGESQPGGGGCLASCWWGPYTAALFTKSSGLPFEVALPIGLLLAGLVAAVFSVVIGIPALRLRGDYLAIITLGFGEIIRVVANNLKFTGGAQGLSGMSLPR